MMRKNKMTKLLKKAYGRLFRQRAGEQWQGRMTGAIIQRSADWKQTHSQHTAHGLNESMAVESIRIRL